jgi:hypothetical protein
LRKVKTKIYPLKEAAMINIGSLDRSVRFVLGVALLVAPFLWPELFVPVGAWRFGVMAIGAVLFVTAAVRICPAYLLFGLRTCAARRA